MELPYRNLDQPPSRLRTLMGVGICIFVTLHIILMSVLVSNMVSIAPEVQTTLSEVKILVPQMHKTLVELGRMLPEIKTGMDILKQLCDASSDCSD